MHIFYSLIYYNIIIIIQVFFFFQKKYKIIYFKLEKYVHNCEHFKLFIHI